MFGLNKIIKVIMGGYYFDKSFVVYFFWIFNKMLMTANSANFSNFAYFNFDKINMLELVKLAVIGVHP